MAAGKKIRSKRKELGMKQPELAEKLGVTKATISKYEHDQIDMTVSTMKKLHDILGISYIDLLDDDTSEEKEITTAYQNSSHEKQEIIRDILRLPVKERK